MGRKLKVAIIAIITIITIITTIAHCPSLATNTRPSTGRQEAPEASLKLPITYIAQQEASIKLPTTYCRWVRLSSKKMGFRYYIIQRNEKHQQYRLFGCLVFLEPFGTGEMHLGDSQALSGCKRRVKPKLVRKLTTPPLCF